MRIVLVGAGGYLARNLILTLEPKHEIHCFVRTILKNSLNQDRYYETKDMAQLRDDIIKIQPQLIINLASGYFAQHEYRDINQVIDVEINLPAHLAEICTDLGVYLLQTKSLFQNTSKGSAINLYSASKNARDELMNYYVVCKELKLINLLLGDVYGKNDNRKKLIPNVIAHIRGNSSKPFTLGNPDQRFYPVYLDDVIAVIEIVLSKIETGIECTENYRCYPLNGITLEMFVHIIQSIISKENFKVNWEISREDFRYTRFLEPETCIDVLNTYTTLESGFRTILSSLDE